MLFFFSSFSKYLLNIKYLLEKAKLLLLLFCAFIFIYLFKGYREREREHHHLLVSFPRCLSVAKAGAGSRELIGALPTECQHIIP